MRMWGDKNQGEGFQSTKEHWIATQENVVDYSANIVEIAWLAFVIADDLPANWKFPLAKFNQDFGRYLLLAENESTAYAECRTRMRAVRQDIAFVSLHRAVYVGFELSFDEKQAMDRHVAFMKSTRETGHQAQLIDLATAGPLLRLNKKMDVWLEENKEAIDALEKKRRDEEELEAITSDDENEGD